MTENKATITIKNKIEPKWENVIFIALWLTIIIGIFLFILIGFILDSKRSEKGYGIFIGFIPFFLIGIKMYQILLWNARGIELISINNKELKIERLGTIFCSPKIYTLIDITGIGLTNKEPYSLFWKYNWNSNEGRVAFKYMNQEKQMGIELGNKDANYIAELLKERVAIVKRTYNIKDGLN